MFVICIQRKLCDFIFRLLSFLIFIAYQTSSVNANPAVYDEIEWPNTNFGKSSVNPDEIHSGGSLREGIPTIDKPQFIKTDEAYGWLHFQEPVVAVKVKKQARAYPLQILIYHEIVNDVLAGEPISVTFCPLCNAAIAYKRTVDGQVLSFGTTGRIRKSDMIMYDRQTESWWQQFTGKAIIGEMAGKQLNAITADIISFEDFLLAYPDAEVLSKSTGFSRPYGSNPYRGYDRINEQPFLLNQPANKRLPPKERVLSVRSSSNIRLYPFSLFHKQPLIEDKLGQSNIVIFSRPGVFSALDAADITASKQVFSATAWERRVGSKLLKFHYQDGRIIDKNTGSEWNLLGQAVTGPLKGKQLKSLQGGSHFAFVWLAFYPEAEIYRLDE